MYEQYPKGSKTGPQPVSFPLATLDVPNKPKNLSYEPFFDGVDNQGHHGTCVANASAALFEFFLHKRRGVSKEVSRYAIYNQAKIDNPSREQMQDNGLFVSDGLLVLKNHGYIEESDFPYVDSNCLVTPPSKWQTDFEIQDFVSVTPTVEEMKKAMSLHGPLIIGTTWPIEFEGNVSSDGFLDPNPKTPAGGHCVLLVGYSDTKQCFRLRNSWGSLDWGDRGYAWFPYSIEKTHPDFFPTDVYTIRA